MCINCNLLTPLEDWAADVLGVKRRTYLVRGHTTHWMMNGEEIRLPYSLAIVHSKTLGAFELVGDITTPTLIKDGVPLYACRYKQIAPVQVSDATAYCELFEFLPPVGDIYGQLVSSK